MVKKTKDVTRLLQLCMFVIAVVIGYFLKDHAIGAVCAMALPVTLKTFPANSMEFAKGTVKFKSPANLASALAEQQGAEFLVADETRAQEILECVRITETGERANYLLGQYYIEFSTWNLDQQNTHLAALAAVQKMELLPVGVYEQQQRHTAILYAEWPELLVSDKGISNSRAAKRYSRAKKDYKDYLQEQVSKELTETAQQMLTDGEITEEKLAVMVANKNIKDASDLKSAVLTADIYPDMAEAKKEEPKVKFTTSLKAFMIAFYTLAPTDLQKACKPVFSSIGMNADKWVEWIKDGHRAASNAVIDVTAETTETPVE